MLDHIGIGLRQRPLSLAKAPLLLGIGQGHAGYVTTAKSSPQADPMARQGCTAGTRRPLKTLAYSSNQR
jgi:hypothetical protein